MNVTRLLHDSMRFKLIVVMVSLAIMIIIATTAVSLHHDINRLKQQLEQESKIVSQVMAQDFAQVMIDDSPYVAADAISRLEAFPMILEVEIISPAKKTILAYTRSNVSPSISNHLLTRLLSFFIEPQMVVDHPVKYQKYLIGHARYVISTAKIHTLLSSIYQLLAVSIPSCIVFATLAAMYLQGLFTQPILQLIKATRHIADYDDYHFRLETNEMDGNEINSLRCSFNDMLANIQSFTNIIKQEREYHHLTLKAIADAVIVTDTHGRITLMNPVASIMTGYSLDQVLGQNLDTVLNILDKNIRCSTYDWVSEIVNTAKSINFSEDSKLCSKDNICYEITGSGAPIYNAEYIVDGCIFVFHDVTKHRHANRKIEESEARFKYMANATPVMIWLMDEQQQCTFVNNAWMSFTGLNFQQAISCDWEAYIHPDDLQKVKKSFYSSKREHYETIEIEYRLKNLHGDYKHILDVSTALFDNNNHFAGYIGSCIDISERKLAEQEIHHLVHYDPLTKLPNRRLILNRLEDIFTQLKREESYGSLMFIDLDHFKTLNDSLGHSVGDLLLIEVAKRIQKSLGETDNIARLGGDEFVVLPFPLQKTKAQAIQEAQKLADRILQILSKPYQLGEYEHHNTPSIGITLLSKEIEKPEDALKQADTAMYQAKKLGRNRYCFYLSEMQQQVDTRLILEKGLRGALNQNQFELFYQPKLTIKGDVIGAEALIRWIDNDKKFISPDVFIPIAEESGLILEIGAWVLETGFKQFQTWQQQGLSDDFVLALNVSPRQFHQKLFLQEIKVLVKKYNIPPQRLTLEITEGVVIDDLEKTTRLMDALRAEGFLLSLDDFGTGYSSLSHLKKLPLDEIKIDRSFMQGIPDEVNDIAIIETICNVAETFCMKTVAEGVENQQQLDFLKNQNCYSYQGYYFSPPINAKKFTQLLVEHKKLVS